MAEVQDAVLALLTRMCMSKNLLSLNDKTTQAKLKIYAGEYEVRNDVDDFEKKSKTSSSSREPWRDIKSRG